MGERSGEGREASLVTRGKGPGGLRAWRREALMAGRRRSETIDGGVPWRGGEGAARQQRRC